MASTTPIQAVARRLFVALDVPTAREALALAERLAPLGVGFKVGMQLFYAEGLPIVKALQGLTETVFVDLKLHDIPNTVAGATASLVAGGVNFLNVHAQGGVEMMRAAAHSARKTAHRLNVPPPRVIGVTLLTSLDEAALRDFLCVEGLGVAEYVGHLAAQARQAGLDGVVCSAREAAALRQAMGPDFLLVTPGIRPASATGGDDQARVVTAGDAIREGASHLVVGRPITGASNPRDAAERVLAEMSGVLP